MAPSASAFRIAQVPATNGVIGMSACPGSGPGGLEADRAVVEAFRPDAIVSLMEAHEYGLMGCADLPAALSRLAARRYDLPFRRAGVPTARFDRIWAYAGHGLRQTLRGGGRVLIHCHSGAGRTGLVAARLLVELGLPVDDAIAAVCSARPRAIESVAQSQYVRARRAHLTDSGVASRILGCLLGGATGDAFGYPIEFLSMDQVRERHGPDGLVEPRLQGGRTAVSDDTQMTLFTAEGLLAAVDEDLVLHQDRVTGRVRRAYLEWFRTQREEWTSHAAGLSQYRELWAPRAPGSTCLTALAAGARGTVDAPINDSRGCGAVMRVAPLGLLPAIDPDQAFRLGEEAAALTHGHPSARLAAAALAGLVRDLVAEGTLDSALDRMEARLDRADQGEEVLAAVRLARALAGDDTPASQVLPTLGQGWHGHEALAIGVYAALKARTFEEAVRLAANHDGDSDSTASIAGQIWGACHGHEDVPQAWIEALDVLEPLCDIGGQLIACIDADDAGEVRRRLAVLAPFARRAATSSEACSEVIRDFVQAVQASDWVASSDGAQQAAEVERLLTDPRAIQRASHVQLRRLATAIVRKDRTSDGTLERCLRSGRISAMARRAEALLVAVAA
ncbi:ADP-ribosylglycohydrolase family protein [Phenylobacterium sp. SCN 70-31]|uniref:ADP-ribosylglycohydrolase family protein n=1 Tax=Phenylobacterium sp. SCN 70-31 TaxID=1660129 RepID=UPI000AC6D1D3|nr:ADP-ribosylglycohydrolase family protein [Phenylobacterium sp. SCN 70-31]